jgi:hypothetical protein
MTELLPFSSVVCISVLFNNPTKCAVSLRSRMVSFDLVIVDQEQGTNDKEDGIAYGLLPTAPGLNYSVQGG